MQSNGVKAFNHALISRVFFLLLSCIANLIITDHVPDAFIYEIKPTLAGDYVVSFLFGGLARWDSQHFLSISQSGK